MTAQEFWKDFNVLFKDGTETRKKAVNSWYSYTDFILGELGKIIKNHNLVPEKEYYRIDLIGYTKINKPNEKYLKNINKYLWNLEVAIEHENSSNDWADELVKLIPILCPLRVVIGYLPFSEKEKHLEYLNAINNEIKKLNSYCGIKFGEFMVIIGDSKCGGDTAKFCRYTPYIYKNNAFELFE